MERIFYYNAEIVTADADCSIATAMVTDGERILAIGAEEDLDPMRDECEREVDVGGHTVLPGFVDSHVHALSPAFTQDAKEAAPAAGSAEAWEETQRCLLQKGITMAQDASGFSRFAYRYLQQAEESGSLRLRLCLMPGEIQSERAEEELWEHFLAIGFRTGFGSGKLRLGALRLTLDTPSKADTCTLRVPDGEDGSTSPLTARQEEVERLICLAHRCGYQLALQANGQEATLWAVRALERAMRLYPRPNPRHRLEHCLFCPPALQKQMRRMGILPVFLPHQLAEWGDVYRKVYGEQSRYILPLRSMVQFGHPCAFGTDFALAEDHTPLSAIVTAIDRCDRTSGIAVGREESVGLLAALRCQSYGGAYAAFREGDCGSLEVGKYADFVILSDRMLGLRPHEIAALHVEETYVGGRSVFRRHT